MKMELRSRAIDKVYKRRDRIEMPDFQREEVWPIEKKRKLIDSILRGWHLPKFYFRKVSDASFECVDGQQRLVAIWEFYDNKLQLNADAAKMFGGSTYKELPDHFSDSFDDFEIDIEEIEETADGELEELFLRLQLGAPLNTPEKLNAVGGQLRDFCKWVADQNFFDSKIALKDTRFAHFDIVTKWLFVEARGVQPQMRFPQLEGLLKENRSFSQESELARRIKTALSFLDAAFPTACDKLRNRANVLSVCMLASRVVAYELHRNTAPLFGKFVNDFFSELAVEVEKGSLSRDTELLSYQEAISYGSTGGDSIRSRINILSRRLATQSPQFAPLLGVDLGTKAAAQQIIESLAQECADLIHSVNEKYAADVGGDIFKMTNESVAAIGNLSKTCDTFDQYGNMIDGLYFIVYEGSSSCKRLPAPPPEFAMDVKFLRTQIRHDIDHGGATEIAKKHSRNASVFTKYSGKRSPHECGPQDFVATHLRILTAMRQSLQELSDSSSLPSHD
jgi:hypothetical protein